MYCRLEANICESLTNQTSIEYRVMQRTAAHSISNSNTDASKWASIVVLEEAIVWLNHTMIIQFEL